jgi:hypothetical protein
MLCDWGAKPVLISTTLGVMRDLVVPVCQACNAWMNKRFETRTMPLLRSLVAGTEQVITPEQQLQLTLWFTKTIMMYDIVADRAWSHATPSTSSFVVPGGRFRGRDFGWVTAVMYGRSSSWSIHHGTISCPTVASVGSYRSGPCSSSCSRSGVPRIPPRSTTGGSHLPPADPPLPRATIYLTHLD